jgi:glucose/arabinose dehydrogenase/plastocyanin
LLFATPAYAQTATTTTTPAGNDAPPTGNVQSGNEPVTKPTSVPETTTTTAAGQSGSTDCTAPAATVNVTTVGNAFDHACYAAPAGPFTINFVNQDPFAHNLSIYDKKGGTALFQGAYVPKASTATYNVAPIPAGAYYYQCDIHPFMNGKFAVGVDPSTPLSTSTQSSRAPKGFNVHLSTFADGFVAPVFITGAGDGSGRVFIVDQIGKIYVVDKHGKKLKTPFLDIGPELVTPTPDYDERGLLGLAFHPDYEHNGRFFVWYNAPLSPTGPTGWNNTIHLSQFTVSKTNPNVADPTSEKILMSIDHPYANHNSGHIAFGPDGYLYMPLGDGGNANDIGLGHTVPQGNGQDLTNILGDIMRIDVDHTSPGKAYAIPKDNPYANGAGGAQPEIFANGFRNPYHISFDAGGDHALYASDAGQDRFEEIDKVVRGGNYGWNVKEATHCFDKNSPSNPPASCPSTGVNGTKLIDPVLEYNHTEILGSVVIGGYVYRGKDIPALQGQYVFGDYSRNRLQPDGELFQASALGGDDAWKIHEMQVTMPGDKDKGPGFNYFVLSFGQDDDNELYVGMATYGGPKGFAATVFKITEASPTDEAVLATATHDSHNDAWYWLPLLLALVSAGALGLWALSTLVPNPFLSSDR